MAPPNFLINAVSDPIRNTPPDTATRYDTIPDTKIPGRAQKTYRIGRYDTRYETQIPYRRIGGSPYLRTGPDTRDGCPKRGFPSSPCRWHRVMTNGKCPNALESAE
jgi:hypothetical protein